MGSRHGSSGGTVASNAALPLVFDPDIGTDVDDALALALILASPEVRLVGVTVTSGDVELRALIAARLLGLAGRQDVPVLIGPDRTLSSSTVEVMLGHEG